MTSHVRKVFTKPFYPLSRRRLPVSARLLCSEKAWEGGVDEDDELDDASKARIRAFNYKLKGLIMIKRYNEVVELWKQYRSDVNNTPHSSTTYELLLNAFSTPETAEALKQDMLRLGVVMSDKCGLAFVKLLLDNRRLNEVVDFVKSDLVLRGSPWFISHVMDFLSERGHPQLSLGVGKMYVPTQLIKGEDVEVIAGQLRAFGHLGQAERAQELVCKEYGDMSNFPHSIKLSLVDVLSLTDNPNEAFQQLTTIPNYGLQTIAYLLESVERSGDSGQLASAVFDYVWSTVQEHLTNCNNVGIVTAIKNSFLLRIYNAMMKLMIVAFRENTQSSVNYSTHNFFREMRSQHIQPNEDTYKTVLMYSCYDRVALKWLDTTIKRLIRNKTNPSPEAMISWCRKRTSLDPETVITMVGLVRLHCHMTEQQLGLKHFKDIFDCNSNSLTVKTVKIVQKMMERFGLLKSNVTACNMVLRGYQDTGVLGTVFSFFLDMQEEYETAPNLQTFHILVDSVLQDGGHRACYSAIYKTWRLLLAGKVQPDVEIFNKLVKCCRLTKDYTRAFYFLSVMDSYSLLPDKDILLEMLKVCNEMNDEEMLKGIQNLADSLYPEHQLYNISFQ